MTNGSTDGALGILVGGGPAPGINSVISSATIEARNSGMRVIGLRDGFEHLIEGSTEQVRELSIEDVSRIHALGGSILRTSRANPAKSPESLLTVVQTLRRLGITHLLTIGGDDTAFSAAAVTESAAGALRVAHVPKTIDNDLPMPSGMPTFGYETARHVGTELVLTIMEESRTINRWFIVVMMGRKAGHLALGVGRAAGATLTVIPEEFTNEKVTLDDVARVIEGSILKRRLTGQGFGVVVVGEGVGERIDPEELRRGAGIDLSYDPHGHIALAEIPLGSMIKHRVIRRFAERGQKMQMTDVTLGYELRCARPLPFDIDYTRTLGWGAVRFLLDEPWDPQLLHGGFVTLDGVNLHTLPFSDLRDPETGRTRVRLVDLGSEHYRVAREYMIRLEPEDLVDEEKTRRLADAAGVTPAVFREEFSRIWSQSAATA
ncbi:MAG TPA: diphosphate--fructose-6-phosphate 1-phosphotransferase [Dehalococcoidia bacterium]|nr:diphosphate--fructose-6-phosphate 1-phosphotransferase [Dehalococcoidia bacterium]